MERENCVTHPATSRASEFDDSYLKVLRKKVGDEKFDTLYRNVRFDDPKVDDKGCLTVSVSIEGLRQVLRNAQRQAPLLEVWNQLNPDKPASSVSVTLRSMVRGSPAPAPLGNAKTESPGPQPGAAPVPKPVPPAPAPPPPRPKLRVKRVRQPRSPNSSLSLFRPGFEALHSVAFPKRLNDPPDLEEIVNFVAENYRLNKDDVLSRTIERRLNHGRQMALLILHHNTRATSLQIGNLFDMRKPFSIDQTLRMANSRLKRSAYLRNELDELQRRYEEWLTKPISD